MTLADQAKEDRSRNLVRNIGNHRQRRPVGQQSLQIKLEKISLDQIERLFPPGFPQAPGERLPKIPVGLDRRHPRSPGQQGGGQNPFAGTDLENLLVRLQGREIDDPGHRPRIPQKMLSQAFLGPAGGHAESGRRIHSGRRELGLRLRSSTRPAARWRAPTRPIMAALSVQ